LIVVCTLDNAGAASYALGGASGASIADLSIPGCTEPTTSVAGCDKVVTDTADQFIGKVGTATAPTETNCPATMDHYQQCQAVCGSGEEVRGFITCFNGTMLGKSACGAGDVTSSEQYAVRGTLTMTTASDVDLKGVQAALADYLGSGVGTDDVLVVLKDVEDQNGNKVSHINYEVRVDDGAQANSVATAMEGLNAAQSSAATAFATSANKQGIDLETGLTASAAPIQAQVFSSGGNFVNPPVPADTDPVTPAPTTTAPAPAPAPAPSPEEESSNTAAIVGGVVGGLVGLGLIAGGGYFFMTRKTMAEA